MKEFFWWFQGEPVEKLFQELLVADPATARLEVRVKGRALLLRVVPTGAVTAQDSHEDINDSRICPPVCP